MIGKATVTVFRNDLAGEPQYELIVPRDQLVSLWQIFIRQVGPSRGSVPAVASIGESGAPGT